MIETSVLEGACRHELVDAGRLSSLLGALDLKADPISVRDPIAVRQNIEQVARIAAFGSPEAVVAAHQLAWSVAQSLGVYPASIDTLYKAIGEGAVHRPITVPAINMRAVAFHSARGVFQAMSTTGAAAVIFELSRGEIGFTGQSPHEYATAILCAAVAEGHVGPVFLQGDHFQISASRYHADADAELDAVEALISEAVGAGFFNIDIDASTLVDLSHSDITDQQSLNADLTVRLARYARALEPEGITISLGGEIGEVGEHNSTPEEVSAYLSSVSVALGSSCAGLSKLSVQTGTRHGGLVLPDGTFGDMSVDFELIGDLTATCRSQYKVAGCVQHGASMLSLEKIARLPKADCIEVHLAAAFLNAVYDCLPATVVEKADEWAKENFSHEWKADWSEAQFLHHARRYPIGPFKQEWWRHEACHKAIRDDVCKKASSYIRALGADNSKDLVAEFVTHGPSDWRKYDGVMTDTQNTSLISDLAD